MTENLSFGLARLKKLHYHRNFAKRLKKPAIAIKAFDNLRAWVVERSKATGCKPVGLISYVGSNPTPCTITRDEGRRMRDE